MKEPLFYYVGILYCLTRLIVNVTATYFPFYIQESLDLPKEFITSLPLINYLTGFVVSFAMKPLAKHLGKVNSAPFSSLRLTRVKSCSERDILPWLLDNDRWLYVGRIAGK